MLTALWAVGMLIGAGLAERVIGHRVGLAAFGTAAVMGATMLWIGLAPIGLAIVAVAFILGSGLTDQSQKMTVAARAMAEKKVVGQRS